MSGNQMILLGGTPQAVPVDPYFYSVTSLLHGDGTNGGQNNTFLDSSTNNFTITRNGNTTQGSFSPFSQTGWSNYFDGTGDYLSVADNTALDMESSNFTIEFWIFPNTNSLAAASGFFAKRANGSTASGVLLYIDLAGLTPSFLVESGGSWVINQASSIPLTAFAWNHVAAVRNGNSFNLYINGASGVSATNSGAITNNTAAFTIGSWAADGTGVISACYFSNFRVVKGTAVYTTAFTPPTAPLTAITNTSLLTCQANRFLDASTNAFAITRNGDVSVQAFSPFNPTSAYSTSSVGGSGYFDGSGDFLTAADSTAWDLSGDYTIEMWLYVTSTPSSPTFFQLGESSNYLLWYLASATKYLTLAGSASITASTAMSLNAWNHVALVRSGGGTNNTVMYLNGVNVGQTTNTTSFTGSASNGVRIGAEYPSGFYVNGYISDVRIVKGTAVYTGAFTPPTAPLTAITNTQLLCNFTNAGILDATSKNDLETVGNAQISTTQSKFGGSSMYFDGTGDYLTTINKNITQFGSGDFTIEGWFYKTGTQAMRPFGTFDAGASNASASVGMYINATTNIPEFWIVVGTAFQYVTATTQTITPNTWVHWAVVRTGNTLRQFVNGVQDGTKGVTGLSANAGGTNVSIGQDGLFASNNYQGYIQDFRITKGIARYTSNFTPPTTAFLTL